MVLFLLCGCGKAAPSQVVIPFELRRGLVVVDADVSGHPAKLILDTGSGAVLLDSTFAETVAVLWSPIRANATGAAAASVKMGWISSLSIGGAKVVRPLIVTSQSLGTLRERVGADIQGTIGYDAFDQYVVTIDYPKRTVTLTVPSAFHYLGSGVSIPIAIESRIPAIDATVTTRSAGKLPLHLSVDIGAIPCVLHLSKRFVDVHDLSHDTVTTTGAASAGLGIATVPDLFLRMPELVIGGLSVSRVTTAMVQEPSGTLGSSSRTDGSVGAELFLGSRLILDYRGKQMWVEGRDSSATSLCEGNR